MATHQAGRDFWAARRALNERVALPYQWSRYEEHGTIENFRIAAGISTGTRKGHFFSDSDLHKWADAASRSLAQRRATHLEERLAEYVRLMAAAQEDDGYLYTYNQIGFPCRRWENLLVEHELYCHGHFIEAGVEWAQAGLAQPGTEDLLSLARRSADLICTEFGRVRPGRTPGHQEIELALLKLHRLTGEPEYRNTARRLLAGRGRMLFPGLRVLASNRRARTKARQLAGLAAESTAREPHAGYDLRETGYVRDVPFIRLRLLTSVLTGRYMQQHRPILRQHTPRGHAVRWAYMMTAAAMAADPEVGRPGSDETAWPGSAALPHVAGKSLERALEGWTYVSGGIGSIPQVEGFGRKWELSDEFAYCETCAAVGTVFLAHELCRHSRSPIYPGLIEWQLYNAASVGIGRDGKSYFYRNPLMSPGGIRRQPWFDTACCPSNISRLWGGLDRYVWCVDGRDLRVNQYVRGNYEAADGALRLVVSSSLPWEGDVSLEVHNDLPDTLMLSVLIPWWTGCATIETGGSSEVIPQRPAAAIGVPDLGGARYHPVQVPARSEVTLRLAMQMDIRRIGPYPRVAGQKGRFAVSRGPLLYCLESPGLTGRDAPDPAILPDSMMYYFDPELLDGIGTIRAECTDGRPVSLIPYYAWGNRGDSSMRVWLKSPQQLSDSP